MAPQTLFSLLTLTALLGLTSGSPTQAGKASTCSPPAIATNVTITNVNLSTNGGLLHPGPLELGILADSLVWASPVAVGQWNIFRNGSFFNIQFAQEPGRGLLLTADQGGMDVPLATGPIGRQQWNVTCTTCPPSGLANNCTFENSDPVPNFPTINTRVCLLNQRIVDLGDQGLVGNCGELGDDAFQIDYHL
ncbi:hypothetical protein C8R46DRAFT_1115545 [Mycena filopes]|nr:hypothetical protein C8R46DRAFT_1115545 [Mycena filopes]